MTEGSGGDCRGLPGGVDKRRSGEEEEAAQRGAVLTHWEICLLVLLWFFFYHQQPSLVGPALPQLELHCSALHCGSGYGLTRP